MELADHRRPRPGAHTPARVVGAHGQHRQVDWRRYERVIPPGADQSRRGLLQVRLQPGIAWGSVHLLRLADTGLFRRPEFGSTYFEPEALEAGVGFTDVVKRPTRGEGDVSPEEIEFGRGVLNTELGVRGVPLVLCVFRHPVTALLGTTGAPGLQARPTHWGARFPHAGAIRGQGGGQPRDDGAIACARRGLSRAPTAPHPIAACRPGPNIGTRR